MMARRIHLFPFRTQKLSFVTPRVVRGTPLARVGSRRAVRGSSSVVEHHLAMVGVAGSNPVFRFSIIRRGGGTGRRTGLKILR